MALNKYTQADVENFPVINGVRQCPSGDYSLIESFGKWCRFGEACIFGEECSLGKGCSFGERCSFGDGCAVSGMAFVSLSQVCLPGLRTVKKWSLVDGSARYEAGCFHGTYEEAIARAGDRAAYRKAIEFLASL